MLWHINSVSLQTDVASYTYHVPSCEGHLSNYDPYTFTTSNRQYLQTNEKLDKTPKNYS